MLGISDAAESIGFRTSGVRISFQQLIEDVPLPCILHWQQRHFVVCYKIRKKRNKYFFHIADPATGLVTYHEEELKKCWLSTKIDGEKKGAALALEPSPEFYSREDEQESKQRKLSFFLQYLTYSATDNINITAICRLYPQLDIVAHEHSYKHLSHI